MISVSPGTSLWEDLFIVSSNSKDILENKFNVDDAIIASKINSLDNIIECNSFFAWNYNLQEKMPLTKTKFNNILKEHIDAGGAKDFPSWFISSLSAWLEDSTRKLLLDKWLADDQNNGIDLPWLLRYAEQDNELYLKILKKLVKSYKDNKSYENINNINDLFNKIESKNLDEACAVLSEATPGIAVCLLSRADISDDYVLQGLKSLSKLSKQRTINIKLDFEMLAKLGPKARLDAMKQLLGLFSKWYAKKNGVLPFKTIPNKEEVANFLFPCSVKYNKEVSDVLQKFDEITQSQLQPKAGVNF